jgi:UDP-glucuronate 4-epimerase
VQVLVTGTAGFIGYHTAQALLARGNSVIGVDSLNAYYDVSLKRARLERLQQLPGFRFAHLDLANRDGTAAMFAQAGAQRVVHLAAQAGVRYSLDSPHSYADSNLTGFLNVLEGCRRNAVEHLVYASSSSVYGANTAMPFSAGQNVDHPLNLYGATKKANELMAHSYAHLFRLPVTGLRFFTVYGPWGRPDMALFKFTQRILAGKPIDVFSGGAHARDFTYIDDAVDGVLRALDRVAAPDPGWSSARPDPATSAAPYVVYNIGNGRPEGLGDLIACLEQALGRQARKNLLPPQPGDMPSTWADLATFTRDTGYAPKTDLAEGVRRFVAWYKEYHGIA